MKKSIALFLVSLMCSVLSAQLSPGEVSYTLSLGIIKAGKASLKTEKTSYNGRDAYKVSLIAATNSVADRIYRIRDTLTTVVTPQIEPLSFVKHSHEGDDVVAETAVFAKTATGYHGKLVKRYKEGDTRETDTICPHPIYDMVSLVLYARKLDTDGMKTGDRLHFAMADGGLVKNEEMIFLGTDYLKLSGVLHDCLVFSIEQSDSKEELLRIYLSADEARVPIAMDISLPFGKAKVRMNQ